MWKGLQQVDLMTPFLFLVAVEGFNGLLKRVMDLNKFTCFRVGREGEVGSLCFTLRMIRTLFYQGSLCAKCCNFEMYSKILQIEVKFEIEFLQEKINLSGCGGCQSQSFASILDCRITFIPFTYLERMDAIHTEYPFGNVSYVELREDLQQEKTKTFPSRIESALSRASSPPFLFSFSLSSKLW